MKVSILFSGGKDSSLAALMLSKFFDLELITCSFDILSNWKCAEEVAKKLKFSFDGLRTSSFKVLKLEKEIILEAAKRTVEDGFPNNGIKYIHQKALEKAADYFQIIADGVRRDDQVPVLSCSEVRRLEDKFNVHYLQPLMGYSRKTIDLLVKRYFTIREYKSGAFTGAEYEFELREIIRRNYSFRLINKIFPKNHTHSMVINVNSVRKNGPLTSP